MSAEYLRLRAEVVAALIAGYEASRRYCVASMRLHALDGDVHAEGIYAGLAWSYGEMRLDALEEEREILGHRIRGVLS